MVMTLRKRAPPPPTTPPPSDSDSDTVSRSKKPKPKPDSKTRHSDSESEDENGYEKCREQRMRENKERMEKLGIFALSSQFNGVKRNSKKPPIKNKAYASFFPRHRTRSLDSRRSDRLRNVRGKIIEDGRSLREMGISIPDGWKSEVYTEEDEKLLGSCDTEWTLNVDGYGEDGERLYDPVSGTSCHQCRQKTIRKHTYCGKCRSPQGQLCGDCLYTRYGENVLEASQNPAWKCPACRGICNCSRCRRAKGWPPVTLPYEKVAESGFKSVAHYLILNRGAAALTKEPKEGADLIDLTQGDTQAPVQNEGSDDEWAESDEDDDDDDDDEDDDDSKICRQNMAQSVDEQQGDEPDPSTEAAGTGLTADSNQGFNEPAVGGYH